MHHQVLQRRHRCCSLSAWTISCSLKAAIPHAVDALLTPLHYGVGSQVAEAQLVTDGDPQQQGAAVADAPDELHHLHPALHTPWTTNGSSISPSPSPRASTGTSSAPASADHGKAPRRPARSPASSSAASSDLRTAPPATERGQQHTRRSSSDLTPAAASSSPRPAHAGAQGPRLPPPRGRGPPDGGNGGSWDEHAGPGPGSANQGLDEELRACRTPQSLQRFAQLHRPRMGAVLLSMAVCRLSQVVAEERPVGDQERQAVASLADDLTQQLRGQVHVLGPNLLTALVCGMTKMRVYDGPLLREAAAAAREAAAAGALAPRHTAGLVWAYARYRRDFGFALEPGWTAALLDGMAPALAASAAAALSSPAAFNSDDGDGTGDEDGPSTSGRGHASAAGAPAAAAATPTEVAMTLYGLALLQQHTAGPHPRRQARFTSISGIGAAGGSIGGSAGAGGGGGRPGAGLRSVDEAGLGGGSVLLSDPLREYPAPPLDPHMALRHASSTAAGPGSASESDSEVSGLSGSGPALPADLVSQRALRALLAASQASLPYAGGTELAMSIWALAALRIDPGSAWISAFLDRSAAATRTFVAGSAVANTLYGLVLMGARPPAAWMQHFLWQAQRRFNTMDAQSLVITLWALSRLRYRPDAKWISAYMRYARVQVLQARGPAAGAPAAPLVPLAGGAAAAAAGGAAAAGAVAAAAAARRQEEQRRLLEAQAQRMRRRLGADAAKPLAHAASSSPSSSSTSSASTAPSAPNHHPIAPQTYNLMLWSFVRLSMRPSGVWLIRLCDSLQPRLGAFAPLELSNLLWSISRLDWRPTDDFMLDVSVAMRNRMPRYQPPDCILAVLAIARLCHKLGYRVQDVELMDALAGKLEPALPRLATTTLVSVTLAAARVNPPLPPLRIAATLAALLERLRAASASASAACGSVAAASGSAAGGGAASAAAAPAAPVGVLAAATSPPPPPLTPREVANALFAVGCAARRAARHTYVRGLCGQLFAELLPLSNALFGGSPPTAALASPTATATVTNVPLAFNAIDLGLMLSGVAAVRLRPPVTWLRRHEGAVRQLLDAGVLSAVQLYELHQAYAAIGYAPGLLPPPPPPPPYVLAARQAREAAAAAQAARKEQAGSRAGSDLDVSSKEVEGPKPVAAIQKAAPQAAPQQRKRGGKRQPK
ncbi:hypothetical protein HYH03_000015 [Edaphochlamys debaryana]|uniref:Uncharacterized protein n=1 Tax=Edaphochlamys debaryana TaxID=47281 RepID=A0A836C6T7_9CHLO|nr:hypothetical protein HYH03_000015 [Edaphochlamys debaryana]|eukprot:KAG2501508.1 hypothetical protein HYH03_000015 [Edaphochlamys debaryana]